MKINRSVFDKLVLEMQEPQTLILTGPRQVGKTTLMEQLEKLLVSRKMRTRFFDLEQPDDLAQLVGGPTEMMRTLTESVDYVFLDEFYYLNDAGKIFKAAYDRAKRTKTPLKIIASGSSSVSIHKHLKESQAGRTITYRIFPLSYGEYQNCDPTIERPNFETYLRFGGLPGLSSVKDEGRRIKLLQEYLSTYLFKDIKGLINEENIRAFNHLLIILAQNQGQMLEVSNLANEIRLSAATVSRYLEILDQTYVTVSVHSYHQNMANELKKSRKIYLYDLGIRNMILKDFRPLDEREDRGAIVESFVALDLIPRLAPNMEMRFWRTKKGDEVDFVVVHNRLPIPLEVKRSLARPTISQGVHAFCQRYPNVKMTFTISDKNFPSIVEREVKHHFISFSEISQVFDLIQ